MALKDTFNGPDGNMSWGIEAQQFEGFFEGLAEKIRTVTGETYRLERSGDDLLIGLDSTRQRQFKIFKADDKFIVSDIEAHASDAPHLVGGLDGEGMLDTKFLEDFANLLETRLPAHALADLMEERGMAADRSLPLLEKWYADFGNADAVPEMPGDPAEERAQFEHMFRTVDPQP